MRAVQLTAFFFKSRRQRADTVDDGHLIDLSDREALYLH